MSGLTFLVSLNIQRLYGSSAKLILIASTAEGMSASVRGVIFMTIVYDVVSCVY